MTIFYLIRHGEPAWSINEVREVVAGRRDLVPLTELGIKQAKEISKHEKLIDIDCIISSPYTRAVQTAGIINGKLNRDLIVEYDLHEWIPDQSWSFKNMDDLLKIEQEYNNHNGIYPSEESEIWESFALLQSRLISTLNKYIMYEKVAVVCHERVIQCLRESKNEVDHCSLIEFQLEGD